MTNISYYVAAPLWSKYILKEEIQNKLYPFTQPKTRGNLRTWVPEESLVGCRNHSALYCDNVSGGSECMCDPGYYMDQDGYCTGEIYL